MTQRWSVAQRVGTMSWSLGSALWPLGGLGQAAELWGLCLHPVKWDGIGKH